MTKSAADTSIEEAQTDATNRRVSGEFVRGVSGFRHAIGDPDFPPEPNRYHLYVAFNCPWCHRVSLARNILGLQDSITMDVAFPSRTDEDDPAGSNLWQFAPDRVAAVIGAHLPECTSETASGISYRLVKEIYEAEGASEKSVPILYDKKTKRIVNNESAEIIRMLDVHAVALGSSFAEPTKLYPQSTALKIEIGEGVLTPREREVVELTLRGHSAEALGGLLGISSGTVRIHRKNIYTKLRIRSQGELFSVFIAALTNSPSKSAS
jgi:putative glutathione S-transferase